MQCFSETGFEIIVKFVTRKVKSEGRGEDVDTMDGRSMCRPVGHTGVKSETAISDRKQP
jgi:hypothetical protein